MGIAQLVLAGCVLTGFGQQPPAGAETRLNVFDPAVVLATGGRTAACDALTFTPDGRTLLAVGDDKCIHTWDLGAKELRYARPMFWNSFRERRGCLYTISISSDGTLAAAGGFGRFTADVVVFDLRTGRIAHALSAPRNKGYSTAGSAVWCVAFDPRSPRIAIGHDDGSVWLWEYAAKPEPVVCRLAAPVSNGETTFESRVIGVGFRPGGEVVFARRNGTAFEAAPCVEPRKLFDFDAGAMQQMIVAQDGTRVFARSAGQRPTKDANGKTVATSSIETRSLPDGKQLGRIDYPAIEFPDSFALDPTGKRIGVGVRLLDSPGGEKVFRESAGFLRIYDVEAEGLKQSLEASFGAKDRIQTYPEGIAFHPDGKRIAVAAGWHHETTVWAIEGDKLKLLDVSEGVGRPVWQVRATEDGSRISFRTESLLHPTDPNDRGTGRWRTFDLKERVWLTGSEPTGNGPLLAAGGWKVVPDARDQAKWWVESADGKKHVIPLDPLRDNVPVCYTFLPVADGDPVTRLAVGHYWGYSLFELRSDAPPRRVRRGAGHHGYVSSIVPALGGKWLVTASRDQTICVWSTEGWANQAILGAKFEDVALGEFQVKAVDPGSPAWEVGLVPGDRIRNLKRAAKPLDIRDWADALANPIPGEELAFDLWRFENQKTAMQRKTSLFQRPIWRFLPTAGKDWVLYRYQDYTYDCGGNGDSYVGWLLGGPSAAVTPEFHPAERFRSLYQNAKEIRESLARNAREPSPFFRELLPPPTIEVKATQGKTITVELVVTPAKGPGGALRPLDKVELWLGDEANLDHMLREWKPEAGVLTAKAELRPEELRVGKNRLVVVAYSLARAEKAVEVTLTADTPRPGVLRGLVIGVDKYKQIGVRDLEASAGDAKLMKAVLDKLGGAKPFERAEVEQLVDEQATPAAILKKLDKIAEDANPDDWFVLYLAGHGLALRGNPARVDGTGEMVPGSWFFAGYAADKSAPYQVEATAIFARLKKAKCRKLILLDSCHAGAATAADGGRDLRPDDKGPIVLAAAAPGEEAGEADTAILIGDRTVRERHGFFTASVYGGLGPSAKGADRNGDGLLTVDELFEFSRTEVNRLRPDLGQTVTMSPWPFRNLVLVGVK